MTMLSELLGGKPTLLVMHADDPHCAELLTTIADAKQTDVPDNFLDATTPWVAFNVQPQAGRGDRVEVTAYAEPEGLVYAFRYSGLRTLIPNEHKAMFDSIFDQWDAWQPPLLVQVDLDASPPEEQAEVMKAITADDGGQEFLEKNFFASLIAKRKAAA